MTLEEKDQYIEENLMALEPDTLRYMVADFMAALQETATLRDKFAMAAMVGLAKGYSKATGYTKGGNVDDCMKLDARLAYGFADAMLEARTK